MADEIGEIDLTPQSEASKTASNYITEIDSDGVFIHQTDSGHDSDNPTDSDAYGVHITDVIRLIRAGVDCLQIASNFIRIGTNNMAHATIGTTGLEFFGDTGVSVAKFGELVQIGSAASKHITIGTQVIDGVTIDGLVFWEGVTAVAYVTNNELYIPRAVVVDSMRIGRWTFSQRESGNMGVFYVG